MLRKRFTLWPEDIKHYPMQSVTFSVDVTSLGYHELYVNNIKVGDQWLQPAVSQLNKRALTVGYDITEYMHEGENEILLWLGQGWGRIYGTPAAARAVVSRSVSDGECGLVYILEQTDSSWQASPSPYSYTDNWQPMHFGGERYDAHVRTSWRPASIYDARGIILSRQEFKGNQDIDPLLPIATTAQPDGSILIDFGRVVTGWFSARFLSQPDGHEFTMEYLDHLEAKPPFTETDTYVSDGTGEEDIVFRNRFHTHAFRYVRVRGIDTTYLHTPISPLVSAQAIPISAVDLTKGATFECSDSRLNAIHDMVKYTLSCLTFNGYMVDCPHIERMGYGGDGNSSTMTLQTLWDVRDLYYNWLTAWSDAMETNGDLPYVAPAFRTGGGPYWSGFIVKAPWCTYLNYGDPILIYRHYDEMCRWLNFVESHCQDGILKPWPDTEKRGWFLGDWLAPEGVEIGGESVLHVSNCFLADCLQLMEKMAHLTGHVDDAPRFAAWRKELLTAIHNHFYHPKTHSYANGTPLDQCYALLQGVPPDSTTSEKVKKQLLKDIHDKYHDHMAVGLVGVPIFTEWCIREHQAELMATLLRQPDYPGYLNMINNGATTTWESWDCGREGKEDRSRVHNCYNGIGIWFYQAVAGIRPDSEHPGYQHFFIDPQPVEGVTWVKATQPTAYGTICVEIENGLLKVDIPEGTTATVLHGTPNERCLSGGKHIIKL